MQSLKDYLNKSPLHCEGILNPDQNQVVNRMTDDVIRLRIQEYCTYDEQKYNRGELWSITHLGLQITGIDKDEKGWYVETKDDYCTFLWTNSPKKSYYDYRISRGYKMDKQKGSLIEGTGIYFRWRKHQGGLQVSGAPNLESTEGLPEEFDFLHVWDCCENSKRLDICNKINVITLNRTGDIEISGNKCKNIIINPGSPTNVTAPRGIKIYRQETADKFYRLLGKLKQ